MLCLYLYYLYILKHIRIFRIALAAIFFVASVVFLFLGNHANVLARMSEKFQLIPSAISATIGVTVFWIVITFLLGRVYCSTVCPVGTLQDIGMRVRSRFKWKRRAFRYKQSKRWRYDLLVGYLICLLLGVSAVCYTIEPWNAMRNVSAMAHPENIGATWGTLSYGISVGIVVGILFIAVVVVWGFISGRDFCNVICPIGTGLGMVSERSVMHIEIDPDRCSGCLKCEDVCRSGCINVVSRYVDNSRCVRCFDCIAVCPDDAIHFQQNRNRRPATPLLRKTKNAR